MTRLESAHHIADRDRRGGARQPEASTSSAMGRDKSCLGQLPDNLRQVVARDGELARDLVGGEHAFPLTRQPHECAER